MDCGNDGICKILSQTTVFTKEEASKHPTIKSLIANEGSKLEYFENETFKSFQQLNIVNLSQCNNLKNISQDAFYGCKQLHTIILPEDGILDIIGGGAFSYAAIESITFPSSLKYLLSHSQNPNIGAFSDCRSLKQINYYSSNSLIVIEAYSFRCCSFAEFYVGPNVEFIIGATFESSTAIFKRIFVNESNPKYFVKNNILYSIDYQLVFCPPGNENITILNGTKIIGNQAFANNIMKEFYQIPNTTTTIATFVFDSCKSLEFIYLPHSISSIDGSCFRYCYNLKSIVIPNSLKSINSNLFTGCISLKLIYIHDNVTSIANDAFSGTNLNRCGIICSREMQIYIQSQFNYSKFAFHSCPNESVRCKDYSILSSHLVYVLFLLV